MAQELLDRYEEITLLYDLTQALAAVFDIPTVCEVGLEKALQAIEAMRAFVIVEIDGELTVVAAHGDEALVGTTVPHGFGISGHVADEGKQMLLHEREAWPPGSELELGAGERVLSVPLIARGAGDPLGAMTLIGRPAATRFTAGHAKLAATIATQLAIAIENSRLVRSLQETERVRHEIEIAASIQRSLLPDEPPLVPGVSLAGRCVPAAQVGGDYFDFVLDDKGGLFLLIADVAGHSISSGLLMAMARSIIRRDAAEGRAPGEVLSVANRAMFGDLVTAGLFITMFCARYEPSSGVLAFANAGHNPPLLRRAGGQELLELDGDGAPLGIIETIEFEERTLQLAAGDRLLMYTDGVSEASNPSGEQYGERRLRELVLSADMAPQELTDRVYDAVRSHSGSEPQHDDVTLVAMAIDPETSGSS